MTFVREIEFTSAFDGRSDDPKKDYGIHGVDCRFYLKGEKGAIQFVIFTNWMLPHVREELELKHRDHLLCRPTAADIGYHSPVQMYDGQTVVRDDCEVIGGPCYYDGSSLQAEPVLELLLTGGSEAVWKRLEEEYRLRFEDEAA